MKTQKGTLSRLVIADFSMYWGLIVYFHSNPGHPFAAALKLARLSAVTIDDFGKETFATGGALDRIQKVICLSYAPAAKFNFLIN